MQKFFLTILVFLPSSRSYLNCRTACRSCRERNYAPDLLEIYCGMCNECKTRRQEKLNYRAARANDEEGAENDGKSDDTRPDVYEPSDGVQQDVEESTQSTVPQVYNDEHNGDHAEYPPGCPVPPPCPDEEFRPPPPPPPYPNFFPGPMPPPFPPPYCPVYSPCVYPYPIQLPPITIIMTTTAKRTTTTTTPKPTTTRSTSTTTTTESTLTESTSKPGRKKLLPILPAVPPPYPCLMPYYPYPNFPPMPPVGMPMPMPFLSTHNPEPPVPETTNESETTKDHLYLYVGIPKDMDTTID